MITFSSRPAFGLCERFSTNFAPSRNANRSRLNLMAGLPAPGEAAWLPEREARRIGFNGLSVPVVEAAEGAAKGFRSAKPKPSSSPSPVVGLIHFPHFRGASRLKLLRLVATARFENRRKTGRSRSANPIATFSVICSNAGPGVATDEMGNRDNSDQYPSVAVSELRSEPLAPKK